MILKMPIIFPSGDLKSCEVEKVSCLRALCFFVSFDKSIFLSSDSLLQWVTFFAIAYTSSRCVSGIDVQESHTTSPFFVTYRFSKLYNGMPLVSLSLNFSVMALSSGCIKSRIGRVRSSSCGYPSNEHMAGLTFLK